MGVPKKKAYMQLHRICLQDCIFCAQPSIGLYMNEGDIDAQLQDYVQKGYEGVIFSGGEPTLSKLFFYTLQKTKELGLDMNILTNGDKLSDIDFTKKSIGFGLKDYNVSIHSHIEEIHDAVVKFPGSYKRSLQAMQNIIEAGGNLTINMTINNYNVDYFPISVSFFIRLFPKMKGFIINNLETSQIKTRYFNVIAPLSKIKKTIPIALATIVQYNKNVRIERVPLCYIRGYEHLSTDVEYTVVGEKKYLHFLDTRKDGEVNIDTCSADYTYGPGCYECDLKSICTGMEGLGKHFSPDDLIPQKLQIGELENILRKI